MKKRYTEEQIIGFLREADAGLPVKELANYTRLKDKLLERPAVHAVLEREKSPLLAA